ncbi:uncharacterized protein V1518DRAFT_419372 [Limtongia smithiae]|uniref:uncharacterized protein n=1 Tax=Limtongia smithiae TaxID=1125753 RepID=UPI0034CF6D8E
MSKVCTRKGCGKSFDRPDESECWYHPGPPEFHDALKGWSCCTKRVISFDDFLAIPGCTKGVHTTEVQALPPTTAKPATAPTPSHIDQNGKEVYGAPAPTAKSVPNGSGATELPRAVVPSKDRMEEMTKKLDISTAEDPEGVPIPIGAKCKRNACSVQFDGTNRTGCVYHPGTAIFHDASKGWSCCKRRVLEFDEFLKIPGCKHGNHLFLGPQESPDAPAAIEETECRTDFYQTPTTVIVSIFAKKCEADKSTIEFTDETVSLDLLHLGSKRFKTTIQLYGPIVPADSKYKVMGTKVELTLAKANGLSWAGLRAGETGAGMIRFGVSGRTGTVGGKEIVYRNQA